MLHEQYTGLSNEDFFRVYQKNMILFLGYELLLGILVIHKTSYVHKYLINVILIGP